MHANVSELSSVTLLGDHFGGVGNYKGKFLLARFFQLRTTSGNPQLKLQANTFTKWCFHIELVIIVHVINNIQQCSIFSTAMANDVKLIRVPNFSQKHASHLQWMKSKCYCILHVCIEKDSCRILYIDYCSEGGS